MGVRLRSVDDRVFALVLERWSEWLMLFYAPPRAAAGPNASNGQGDDVWSAVSRAARGNTENADCVLAGLLSDERRQCSWPASIHAAVCDMPKAHQLVLLGAALRVPQSQVGDALGVRQQFVSELLAIARQALMLRVYGLGETVLILNKVMGLGLYHEHSGCASGKRMA